MKVIMKFTCAIVVAALIQLFVWASAGAQPLQKIRIGYPSISSRQGAALGGEG
jgi:ABC-type proline/glycine betaine transport system substrate-binding protein